MTSFTPKLVAALVLVGVVRPAAATWSIVATDTKTGEVAVATATCVNNYDLEKYCPVIRAGYGAASHQAVDDSTGALRKITWEQLVLLTPPDQILALIDVADNAFPKRQIGIVDLLSRSATHTGSGCGAWAGAVSGQIGSITYAIFGNVLTGEPVVLAAETAFRWTDGDLADRLMAGMEAARTLGGDGRCSCSPAAPTSCGAPPPAFVKTAHIGYMIIARIGDVDGVCTKQLGCSNGQYFMNLNVKGNQLGLPDPVLQLAGLFQSWRESWVGRPDHLRSEAYLDHPVLSADGAASATLHIRLRDWEGTAVPVGGALVTASVEPGGANAVVLGAALDHGDGSYSVPVSIAAGAFGVDRLRIVADDGAGAVTLYPFPEVAVAKPGALAASTAQIWGAGGDLALRLDAGPGLAGREYLVLCSTSGTAPGFSLGSAEVPLAFDLAVAWSAALCNVAPLVETCGTLNGDGCATANLRFTPQQLHALAPGALSFAFVTLDPSDYASAPALVAVGP